MQVLFVQCTLATIKKDHVFMLASVKPPLYDVLCSGCYVMFLQKESERGQVIALQRLISSFLLVTLYLGLSMHGIDKRSRTLMCETHLVGRSLILIANNGNTTRVFLGSVM
ncbi:hypothetical protein SAY86_017177 [Trapa natans]|uniref:Uncharacterized protein n=1 Tax=Trapa natans TaxID=22666 RepID=A0AAN7R8K1_TRANT|nr:hypothetical protein SAY86_017177 [Trapa natans]